jgi:NADPH-ferrihemoprotein reductase
MLPKLALYATSKDQQTKLLWLASTEGRDAFQAEILIPGRTILEIMEKFPSLKIPFGAFVELVPRLMARDYTISSSSVVNPNICSITCKVLRDSKEKSSWECLMDASTSNGNTSELRIHRGVCSNYLFREGSTCRVYVKQSTFKLPEDTSLPIILIGPGTGIAPMRAFLQERKWQRDTYGMNKVGETDLYFGCRRPDEDYIYEEELLSYTRDGTLTRLELGK